MFTAAGVLEFINYFTHAKNADDESYYSETCHEADRTCLRHLNDVPVTTPLLATQDRVSLKTVSLYQPLQPEKVITENDETALWNELLTLAFGGIILSGVYYRFGSKRFALPKKAEFVPWYQPVIDTRGVLHGVEILARCRLPGGEILSPSAFIPAARAAGRLPEITASLLKQAAWDLQPLLLNTTYPYPLRIAVNITRDNIRAPAFIGQCDNFVKAFPASRVKLIAEITEQEPANFSLAEQNVLARLAACGTEIALDDFGTAVSNLEGLRLSHLQYLKLDRSFLPTRGMKPEHHRPAEAVLAIARVTGLEIIAEGVETQEQRDWLNENGVYLQQGFLFSPPVPGSVIAEEGFNPLENVG
ncbi:EAL domain-containing protein [Cedecea sp.]|uniref:EAL domain-containing protein n=1 Tax=Cedecea sp. TaxID=1970739 RepID=UPI002F4160DB